MNDEREISIQYGFQNMNFDQITAMLGTAFWCEGIKREDFRRRGIGQRMIRSMLDNEEMKDVYQWTLITRDAHEVYRKVGFTAVARATDWMEIRKARPYR